MRIGVRSQQTATTMIDIMTKIHDKFSIEFKVGFVARRKLRMNDFSVGMWIFVPNSLDINPSTYPKSKFYRDVKSNVRLITPRFLLREIVGVEAVPLHNIERAFQTLASSPTRTAIADYEYQIKMFVAIVKSALRDELNHIISLKLDSDIEELCRGYMDSVTAITTEFRRLRSIINTPTVPPEVLNCYLFGDEYLCALINQRTLALIRFLERRSAERYVGLTTELSEMLRREQLYCNQMGYGALKVGDRRNNRDLVYRYGVLKKYIESDLFLKVPKKRDGVVVEQLYYSIAAGLSMIFATIVSFAFQQRYGNFTIPLFIALVVSYMLKDRIKELMRFYFAHRVGSKYFDNKATISINNHPIGWMKEGMDFISENKVPHEVMELRRRSALLQAENRLSYEKIILYRKSVHIDRSKLDSNNIIYPMNGINDIIRLHVNTFIQKLDNPQVPLWLLNDEGKVETVECDKVYFLNIVLQYQYEDKVMYRRVRIGVSRSGIKSIDEME